MRIIQIISGDLWGGAESMAYELISKLSTNKDLEVITIVLNDGKLADLLRKSSVKVQVINENKSSFNQILLTVRKIFKSFQPHIVHSHGYKENTLAFLTTRLTNGVKLVSTQHGLREHHKGLKNIKYLFFQWINGQILSRWFHSVVAVSNEIGRHLNKCYHINPSKLRVIHNGISLRDSLKNNRKKEKFVIGSAGRFVPVKGFPFMVEVAKIITSQKPSIRFRLAGDGPQRLLIESMLLDLELNEIFTFDGFLENMNTFYQGLDLYIISSLHEGIPMGLLEAMSYGIPTVATKVGGIPEVIRNGIEGFLIEDRNPSLFAQKCLLLDKEMTIWQKMSNAARERVVKDFSREVMVERYLQLYKEIIG